MRTIPDRRRISRIVTLPHAPQGTSVAAPPAVPSLFSMTKAALAALAGNRGLDTSGTRQALIGRLSRG